MPPHFTIKASHLALYPAHCYCEVDLAGRTWTCRLIALYSGGVRLRAPAFRAMGGGLASRSLIGQALFINIRLADKDVESGGFPAMITSHDGDEIIASFGRPLGVSLARLAEANPRHFPR